MKLQRRRSGLQLLLTLQGLQCRPWYSPLLQRRISHSNRPVFFSGKSTAETSTPENEEIATDKSSSPSTTSPDETSSAAADHKVIGNAQKLFTSSPYSPGSPLFHPRGAHIFNRLVAFLRAQYPQFGFEEVITPTIYKPPLWKKSGHWHAYSDAMFTVHGRSSAKETSCSISANKTASNSAKASEEQDKKSENTRDREDTSDSTGDENDASTYGLKPMNCPGHCLLYASTRRSYRDLPIRYADFSTLHRDEVSGALSGLTRLRRFHQDDGHIFCRPSQVAAEIARTLAFVKLAYKVLGIASYRFVLSTRPKSSPHQGITEEGTEKSRTGVVGESIDKSDETNGSKKAEEPTADDRFIGTSKSWQQAEGQLMEVLRESGKSFTVDSGGAAFYGPKIDIIVQDAAGKEHQTATIQLDMQMPRRFGLTYATTPKIQLVDDAVLKVHDDVGQTNDSRISNERGIYTKDMAEGVSSPKAAIDSAELKHGGNGSGITTTDQEQKEATPILIHRAVLGSVERFMALLLENYNGRYPFWLSPRPAILLSVSQGATTLAYIRKVAALLSGQTATLASTPPSSFSLSSVSSVSASSSSSSPSLATSQHSNIANLDPDPDTAADIFQLSNYKPQTLYNRTRVHINVDVSATTLGRKIKAAKKRGYNHILVVGPKDVDAGTVQVEVGGGQRAAEKIRGVLASVLEEVNLERAREGDASREDWDGEREGYKKGGKGSKEARKERERRQAMATWTKVQWSREIRKGHVEVEAHAARKYFERLVEGYM